MAWAATALQYVAAAASIYSSVKGSQKAGTTANAAQGQADYIATQQQNYGQQLDSLMKDPSSVSKLSNYQFMLNQGSTNLARTLGSKGYHLSGNEFGALTMFGQDYAKSAYQQQVDLLSKLSGISTTNVADLNRAAAAAQGSSASQSNDAFGGLGFLLQKLKGGLGGMIGGGGGIGGGSSIFSMNDAASGNSAPDYVGV